MKTSLKQSMVTIIALTLLLTSVIAIFYGFIQHNYPIALCGLGTLFATFSIFVDFKELIEKAATPVKMILWVFMLSIILGAALTFATAIATEHSVLLEYALVPFILMLFSCWMMVSVGGNVALMIFFTTLTLISASLWLLACDQRYAGISMLTAILFLGIVGLGRLAKANNFKLI